MDKRGLDDWVEIFRGGRQVDADGREHDGDALIGQAVENFNPTEHEPPLVVGHPLNDAPAYGWVKGLRRAVKNGVAVLEAKFEQVAPELVDLVKKGLFKKRSAAFYGNGRLRHVGFLGAAPPAIKGLADISFAQEQITCFEFQARPLPVSESCEEAQAHTLNVYPPETGESENLQEARARQYGIAIKDGGHATKPTEWADVPEDDWLDPVNYRYPCPDADHVRAAAAYWAREANQADYSIDEQQIIESRLADLKVKFGLSQPVDVEQMPANVKDLNQDEPRKTEEEIRRELKAELEQEFAERDQRRARSLDLSTRLDRLIENGQLPPAIVNRDLKEFILALDQMPVMKFSETTESPADFLLGLFEKIPRLSLFAEMATRNEAGPELAAARRDEDLGRSIAAKIMN